MSQTSLELNLNKFNKIIMINDVIVQPVSINQDHRGWLAELYREDDLPIELLPMMAYISETLPGITRGPHEHINQTDYFVFIGPSDFLLCLWDARPESSTYGNCIREIVGASNKQSVIVPPGVVHGYKNVGLIPGWVFNAPNRLYAGVCKNYPVDEIRHEESNVKYVVE